MYFDWTTFFYSLMFVPLLGWAAILAWRWFKLPGFAGEVYDSNVEKGLLSAKIPRETYIEHYLEAERPRLAIYRCAVAFICLLMLPGLVSFFYGLAEALNEWNEANAFRIGEFRLVGILGDFVTFLLIMGTYVALLLGATALYFRNPAPSLKSQERKLREQFE